MTRKITAYDFSTNRKMLNKELLRYCENYCSYIGHIVNYFGESLNRSEVAWLVFLINRIKQFLKDAPHSEFTAVFESRYKRVLTKLEKYYVDQPTQN